MDLDKLIIDARELSKEKLNLSKIIKKLKDYGNPKSSLTSRADDAQKESEQYEHIAGLFEELKLYRELGTVKEFKELKKKNETKKLKVLKSFDEEYGASWCSCPNCARGIGWNYQKHFNFCWECGTELIWE